MSKLSTTGTPSSSNFLRGDGAWSTPTGGDGTDPFGFVYTIDPRMIASSAANVGAANRAIYMRVTGCNVAGVSITKVGFQVGTSSGNVDVGVFANSGSGRSAVAGSRTRNAGSTACPAGGYAEVSLSASATVNPGDWLALAIDNQTATLGNCTFGHVSNIQSGLWGWEASAFTLPSTATPSIASGPARALILVGVP